jgi:hypothetical protein
MEGRESAYHPTLDSFTSEPSKDMGWPRAVRGTGQRLQAIAASTLPDLYPGAWSHASQHDTLPSLIDSAVATLQLRDADAVLVHLPKDIDATAVDHAIADIHKQLTQEDTLVIFGTYGLNSAGAPGRDTWYLAKGPKLISARLPLEQIDLTFLLARLSKTPLPENYEGRLRWELLKPDADEQVWRAQLANAWERPQVGRRDLSHALERRQQHLADRPARNIGSFIPWLLHIFLIGGAVAASFAGETRLRQSWLAWQVTWLSACFIWPDEVPWLALIVQIFISWPRAGGWGGVPALVLWGVLAFGSGVVMPQTQSIFDRAYAGPTSVLVWYFLVGGIPLLIGAFAMSRLGARSRWSRAALVALGSIAIIPPPGAHYFSAAQGVTRALYPLIGFVILVEARPRTAAGWIQLIILLSASSFGIIDTDQGGWVSRPLTWLESIPEHYRIGIAFGCFAAMTIQWWSTQGVSKAVLGGSTLIVFSLISHHTFDMPWERLAALAWLHWALAAGLELLRSPTATVITSNSDQHALMVDLGPDERLPGVAIKSAWQIALTLSTAFVSLWVATGGPYLTNLHIDELVHHFALRFSDQWLVGIAVLGWSAVGWSLVVGMAPLTLLTTLRSERLVALGRWVLLLVSFKVFGQGMQYLGVRLVEDVKWSDILMQEAMAVSLLAVLLWTYLIIVALYRHGAQWLMGRDRVF